MPTDGPGEYEIGYKKPPVASRFQKGNNANPRGRPRSQSRGAGVLAAVLQRALDETAVDGNGRRRRRSKREIVIRRLVEKSTGADLAATKLLFDLLGKADPSALAADPAAADPLGGDALSLLKHKLARLARARSAAAPTVAGSAIRSRRPARPHRPARPLLGLLDPTDPQSGG